MVLQAMYYFPLFSQQPNTVMNKRNTDWKTGQLLLKLGFKPSHSAIASSLSLLSIGVSMDLFHKKPISEQLTTGTIAFGSVHKPHLQTGDFLLIFLFPLLL